MAIDYISSNTAPLYTTAGGNRYRLQLLWGDRVRTYEQSGSRTKVKARGCTGWVRNSDLGGDSLLELYFIDVGQGDGVLIRTPNHRHILIDGGYNRGKQPTGKNAADFVDWKFKRDYGRNKIDLDAMIVSHCDADHYGGLWDLLNPDEKHELEVGTVEVDTLYHAGISWWKKPGGGRYLGPKSGGFLTQLLEGRTSVRNALRQTGSGPRLQGEWAKFMQRVYDNGCSIARLSHADEWLPGFEPANNRASIRVLAPVEYEYNGNPALESFGSNSKNTNGQSILLRIDYGHSRILITGDLNKRSQQKLLEEWSGQRTEFLCDVAKGCHHGSDDVSYEFLQAMNATATVISSGDNESHSHPRPKIVAASGITGRVYVRDDELITPLIYSTEVSRSVSFGEPTRLVHQDLTDEDGNILSIEDLDQTTVHYTVKKAGDLSAQARSREFGRMKVVDGVVYGLVNVRTDGQRIFCATLNEKKSKWDYETFESRF